MTGADVTVHKPPNGSLTIAISSYERRDRLHQLLDTIAAALASTDRSDIDVLVVLDGSSDGSEALVEVMGESYPVPLRSSWQPNAGLAAARNRCVDEARGGLVWLLDDDMMVTPAALATHRGHDRSTAAVLMGPCHVATDDPDMAHAGAFYAVRHANLATAGRVMQPQDCSFANTSAPTVLLRAHRFDERFRGYGIEDYELAARLLAAGEVICFDATAEVTHDYQATRSERLGKMREEGANRARLSTLYPERTNLAFDPTAGRVERALRRVAVPRMAGPLWFAASATSAAAAPMPRRCGRHRLLTYADLLAVYSGVAGFRSVDDISGPR